MSDKKHPLWFAFVRRTVRLFLYQIRLGGIDTIGGENVPKKGAVLLLPNHVSDLDPPAVSCATPRRLSFVSKESMFRGLLGKILVSLGAFPIRRGEGDTESIRKCLERLGEGEALLMFPEGTRGDGKRLLPMTQGAAMLAKKTGVPVIPIAIVGTHIALPKGSKKLVRHRIKVVFGKPFTYADIAQDGPEKQNRLRFGEELARRICEQAQANGMDLLPPEG